MCSQLVPNKHANTQTFNYHNSYVVVDHEEEALGLDINYTETYNHIIKQISVRTILCTVAIHYMKLG